MKSWLARYWRDAALLTVGVGLAVAIRATLLDFKSIDYFNYTKGWHNALKTEGFSAFGRSFANYNLPYLYLQYIVIRLFPDVNAVRAIKLPSLLADFIAAWLVFRIVQTRFSAAFPAALAGFTVLFAPTIILNSAFWGQADSVYVCVLLACVLALIRRSDSTAMAFFGLALAFKAQAIFLAPLLAGLLLRGTVRWRTLPLVPIVYFLSLLPAWAAGRPIADSLLIYPAQAAQYQRLTLHAPSALAWIPDTGRYFAYFDAAGIVLAAAAALAVMWAVQRSTARFMPGLLVEVALLCAIALPFLLPRMHERYFFLADVLSIAVAFLVPSLFYAPLVMITISFLAYQPTLFGVEPASMSLLAMGVFCLVVALLRHLVPQLQSLAQESRDHPAAVESAE